MDYKLRNFLLLIAVLAAAELRLKKSHQLFFGETSITNANLTAILVNQTASIANVVPGETYTITVKGNTNGDFDNDIVAFIDWNHNNILDNEGEIYEVGTISNSTGSDAVNATMSITIPADAVTGSTRIRITKIYTDEDSPAFINPCAIEMDAFGMGAFPGYGQALDFTLQIGTLATVNFDVNTLKIYPVPTKDILNIEYKSVLNSVKIYNFLGQEVYVKNLNSTNAQLDLSALASGSYIVKLSTDQAQHSFKIVKQ